MSLTPNRCCCSVPLPEFSTFVLRHVVDLVYNGQIMVAAEVKPRIEAALEKMKIKGVIATTPAEQLASAAKEAAAATAASTTQPKKPTPPNVTKRMHLNRFGFSEFFHLFLYRSHSFRPRHKFDSSKKCVGLHTESACQWTSIQACAKCQ